MNKISDIFMLTIMPGCDIPTLYEGRFLTEVRQGLVETQVIYYAYYVHEKLSEGGKNET